MVGSVTATVDTKDLKDAPKGDVTDPTKMKELSGGKITGTPTFKDKKPDNPSIGKQGTRPVYVEIPAKYADPKTSGLTLEIKAGKNVDKTVTLE